jgi:hypothetical protein
MITVVRKECRTETHFIVQNQQKRTFHNQGNCDQTELAHLSGWFVKVLVLAELFSVRNLY